MTPKTNRTSTEIKVFTAKVGLIVRILAGFLFMGGGAKMTYWALLAEKHEYVWAGIGIAVFGAWILPTLDDQIKSIYITIFPNGIPLLGGRRSTDPQPPAPPALPVEKGDETGG